MPIHRPYPDSARLPAPARRFVTSSALALAVVLSLLGAGAGVARADGPAPAAMSAAAPLPAIASTPAYDVDVVDLDWVDATRQREVPARLYLPVNLPAGQRAPLIVFSHGMGGSRFGYSHLGRHWAEQGFASLHVQHRGSDRSVWTSGMWDLFQNLQAAASDGQAIARAQDVSFGITSLLADARVAARIDAGRIAVAGHSYGANTALLVAGATVAREVDGHWKDLNFRDERVKAAVLMSAPPFYGESDMRSILKSVRVPTLHVTGTEDVIRIPGYRSDPSDRIKVFESMPSGPDAAPKLLAVFTGATHSIFTDRTDRAGPELNRSVKAATRELTTEFFRSALKGAPYERVAVWLERNAGPLSKKAAVLGSGLSQNPVTVR
jgi:predicted dienelactone hydrolase